MTSFYTRKPNSSTRHNNTVNDVNFVDFHRVCYQIVVIKVDSAKLGVLIREKCSKITNPVGLHSI